MARLANALRRLGIGAGDRVATFAWNGHRHLELYFAVPMIGAVLHTVNIRLFADQCAFVLDHAGDRAVFYDGSLAAAVEAARALDPRAARAFVCMGAPAAAVPGALDYETLLAAEPETYDWPVVDEHAGMMLCYTSATTGDPKGVLYSHRSTYLHTLTIGMADVVALRERDRCLPIVPMFHANAWGTPYLALMVGADYVLPMERLDPAGVIELCERERVTASFGVPTVWLGVRDVLLASGRRLPDLERILIGGSAMPAALYDDFAAMGITMQHGWGMTEMSPVGTLTAPIAALADRPDEQRRKRYTQGLFLPVVEYRLVDEHGADVAHDGTARGELLVRGFTTTASYYENAQASAAAFEPDGWFHTGDIATIDPHGYLEIVDRAKDFIKSGGEWISSVEVENLIMGHPQVKEACVFGVPHPTWQERPVAAVVPRDGETLDEAALRAWLADKLAKWQTPDRILFLAAIPRTGVGKFLKRELRERYGSLLTEPAT